tara:strand:- start:438 stop:1175 length:738 start_codon:yes stop_codon:yes gene_type:complete
MRILTFSIVCLAFVFSCKKQENRTCYKSIGDESIQERSLESFSLLDLGPHLRYVLVQDTVNKVLISGGKNLLNFIETNVSDDKLTIVNKNKCNFLRKLNHVIVVEIHFKEIINIYSESTEEVFCESLTTDYLTIAMRDGVGTMKLNINVISINVVVSHGWGNFELTGDANYAKFIIRSNGFGDANGLIVNDSIHAISNSSEYFEINASNCILRSQTHENGDIWYVGVPSQLEHFSYGSGLLIDKN